jgi:Lsr2
MAKKVTVSFVDDLDGRSAADETVFFGLDGISYEIDLSARNATKLRGAYQPFIDAGRRVGGRRRAAGASRVSMDRARAAAIRQWARENRYQVALRGRIPAALVDAYDAARTRRQGRGV